MLRTRRHPTTLLLAIVAMLALMGAAIALNATRADAQGKGSVPAPPTGLSAMTHHDHVILSWDNPQDDTVTGYEILRRDKDKHRKGEFKAIKADTGSKATTYTDRSVLPKKRYMYRIKAINKHGKSEMSKAVRGYTPAAPESDRQESRRNFTLTMSAEGPFSFNQPYVGIQLTASLNNSGGESPGNVRWQWERSIDKRTWREIDGANQASYTPVREDFLDYLRVTATYETTAGNQTVDRTKRATTKNWTKIDVSEPLAGDFSDSISTPGYVRVGSSVTGTIVLAGGESQNVDGFRVDLVAGRKYRIDLVGHHTGHSSGAHAFPQINGVFPYDEDNQKEQPITGTIVRTRGKSRVEFATDRTGTHVASVTNYDRRVSGGYKLTIQEINDDLGTWHTDWGAEEMGGFLYPFRAGAQGSMHKQKVLLRNGRSGDTDAFLFYLGHDDAPMNTQYILTVSGLDAPWFGVETFYDVSDLDVYIDHFGLDDDFTEFPTDRNGRRIQHRNPGTRLGSNTPGTSHMLFNPGRKDVGAYTVWVRTHRKFADAGRNYKVFLRGGPSRSEPDDGDFPTATAPWLASRTQGWLNIGDSVTGKIGDGGAEQDMYAVLLRAGRTYRIEVKGSETNDGTMADPAIIKMLYDRATYRESVPCSQPNDCFFNDDGGQGLNARLDFTAPTTELYFVEVGNYKAVSANEFDDDREGTYTLSVTDVTNE